MTHLYEGRRERECRVYRVDARGRKRPLDPRHDIAWHCRDGGLDWGNRGGGATQTALAILADYQCDAFADNFCEEFRDMMVLHFDDDWKLTERDLAAACFAMERGRAARDRIFGDITKGGIDMGKQPGSDRTDDELVKLIRREILNQMDLCRGCRQCVNTGMAPWLSSIPAHGALS